MTFFRTLFLLLLLANLVIFAIGQGYFFRISSGEPERLNNQLLPEKIRIVGSEGGAAVAPAANRESEALARPLLEVCRVLNNLTREQAQRVSSALAASESEVRTSERMLETPNAWWVHVPPQADRKSVDARISELRRAGVADFFVMQEEGANRYAISLGVFRTDAAARDYLESVKRKGFAGARIAPRYAPEARRSIELRGHAETIAEALARVTGDQPELRPAECPAAAR